MPKYVRTKWTSEQLRVLNETFLVNPFPSRETRASIAAQLNVTQRNVQVWFQNTRQRGHTKKKKTYAVHSSVNEDISLLATSIDAEEDAFDEEHVSSISMLVGVDPAYVRCVMEDGGMVPRDMCETLSETSKKTMSRSQQ